MYIIGLTGNIATGKSTVGRMLADLGARYIDADEIAHQVIRRGGAAFAGVVQAFGRGILDAGGEIDRRRLGAIVFADAARLRHLEAIVHPAVLAADRRGAGARWRGRGRAGCHQAPGERPEPRSATPCGW